MIDGLARRYHQAPHTVMSWPVWVLQMIGVLNAAEGEVPAAVEAPDPKTATEAELFG